MSKAGGEGQLYRAQLESAIKERLVFCAPTIHAFHKTGGGDVSSRVLGRSPAATATANAPPTLVRAL
jgi:hypothetical protein